MSSRAVCVLLSCCLLSGRVSLGDESAPARAAADALNAIKAAGTACPPSWSNASVDKVERLDLPSGLWHLAHVTAAGQRAGYVLLLERENAFVTVMYSGSAFSQQTAKGLSATSIPAGKVVPVENWGVVPSIEMICLPQPNRPGVQVGPVSCCIASLLQRLERVHGVHVFHSYDFGAIEWAQRLPPATPEQAALMRQYRLDARVRDDPELSEPVAEGNNLHTLKDPIKLHDHLGKIIRSYLFQDVAGRDRWELFRGEESLAAAALPYSEKAPGQARALVVQSYLDGMRPLSEGLSAFSRSRGLRLGWRVVGAQDLSPRDAPCVLHHPDGYAGLVVAVVGQGVSGCVLVGFPETIPPRRSTPDEVAKAGNEEWKSRGGKLHAPPLPNMTAEQRLRFDQLRKQRAGSSSQSVLVSTECRLPDGLAQGLHVCDLRMFSDWQVCIPVVDQATTTQTE